MGSEQIQGVPRRCCGGSSAGTSFQAPRPPQSPSLGRRWVWGAGAGGNRLRERHWAVGTDDSGRTGRGEQNWRRAVTRRAESVPGGAGDEEAHVVQGPPGAGLGPRPLRTLGRRGLGLGLRRPRGALAAAQLSAHGLQEQKPVRCSASPPAPSPPLRPSPRAAGAAGPENPSAGLHGPLARAAAPGGAVAVTSPPRRPPEPFPAPGAGPTSSTPPTSNRPIPSQPAVTRPAQPGQ